MEGKRADYRDDSQTKWAVLLSMYEAQIDDKMPLNITSIMSKTNLKHTKATRILGQLYIAGGVEKIKKGGDFTYSLTDKSIGMIDFLITFKYEIKKLDVLGILKPQIEYIERLRKKMTA